MSNSDTKKVLPEVKLNSALKSTAWDVGTYEALAPFGLDNDGTIISALNYQADLSNDVKNLIVRRNNQHPSLTQYSHLQKITRDYNSLVSRQAKLSDAVKNTISSTRKKTNDEFEKSLNFSQVNGEEIRTALRGMTAEERQTAITKAVNNKDGGILGAVLYSHPVTSGLDQETITNARNSAIRQHRPDLAELETQLNKLDGLTMDAFTNLLTIGDTLTAKDIMSSYEQQAALADSANI